MLKGLEKMVESYSGFGGNGEVTGFSKKLRDLNVGKVYLVGLALDYCVGSTAEDAAKEGFETYILRDATRSVAPDSEAKMLTRLDAAGVKMIQSSEL